MIKNIRNEALEGKLIKLSKRIGQKYAIPLIVEYINVQTTCTRVTHCSDELASNYAIRYLENKYLSRTVKNDKIYHFDDVNVVNSNIQNIK